MAVSMFERIPQIKMRNRKFHRGERVFVCDYENNENMGFGKLISVNYTPKKFTIYGGSVATIVLEKSGKEVNILGHKVYKIAPRISKRVGEVVCYEHNMVGSNYPYYMPNNDENYYRFELGL